MTPEEEQQICDFAVDTFRSDCNGGSSGTTGASFKFNKDDVRENGSVGSGDDQNFEYTCNS